MKSFLNKNNIIKLIMGIILLIISFSIYLNHNKEIKILESEKNKLKKEILLKDSMIRHKEGVYSKLVNDINTEKSINDTLKKNNKELYDIIKKHKDKVIANTEFTIIAKDKEIESIGTIDDKDSIFKYTSNYPDEINPFIIYKGNVDYKNKIVKSAWKFNPISVNVVLTEKENGMWNTYVDVPDYFKVNNLIVNSLPKEEINKIKERKVYFYLGGGLMKIDNISKATVNGGVGTKNWLLNGGYGGKNTYNINLMKKF